MKTVAVLGAGASGLAAIKCCLDEGLEPTCFERTNYIGGLWHYTDNVEEGQSCVMKSTVINTSKEMMCYSDFPIPQEYPPFMHNKYVDKYFNLYANQFKLRDRTKFSTEILQVKQAEDFEQSGRWDITVKNKLSGDVTQATFDAVLVCTGHHAEKNEPTFTGMEKFKGKVSHSHDYKDFHGYDGQRVVVVGIGNSGGDIAVELSRTASQVYLSTRRGSWILNRVAEKGKPVDMTVSRFMLNGLWYFPYLAGIYQRIRLNFRFDHRKYCLEPPHDPFAAHPTVNDDLPNRLVAGTVKIKANIAELTESSITFEDGTVEEDIDALILATGYIFGFPFLDKNVIDVKENKVNLYKYVFPPQLSKPTLAVIGCIQPLGAIMPISEQQCRLATRVFQGKVVLPDQSQMETDIHRKEIEMSQRYVKSPRHTIQVDYQFYMDELAELTGNKPEFGQLFLSDPKLAFATYFGPVTPYQYRLVGPGAWKPARESILTQWDRTFYPLSTARPLSKPDSTMSGLIYAFVIAVILILIYFIF